MPRRPPAIQRARPRERLEGSLREAHEDALGRVASALKALRLKRGLTQEALAERADLSTASVAVIEGRRSNVTVGTLVALAHGLEVDVSVLLKVPGAAKGAKR